MKKLFSLIFIFLLLSPAGVWVTGIDVGIHMDRLGLKPPRFYKEVLFDNEYYLSFDQYFKDNFSLRGPLIFAKNWLDYHLFRTTDSREVHVGLDGWLYNYRSIEDYRKEACNNKAYAEQLVLELHALEKITEASGRRFFFTIVPNKPTIYPEFVGFVPKGDQCDISLYDLFLENVTAYPLRSFIRLDRSLKDEKKNPALLYDKTGTQWNSMGAMVAAKTIFKNVFNEQGKEAAPDFEPLYTSVAGDLTGKLMGLPVAREEKSIRHLKGFDRSGLPSAAVYGDAFMSNLIPYMAGMFKKLDMISTDHIPSRQHGENLKSYDIILIERAEAEIGTINLELDRIFSALEAEAPALVRHNLDLKEVVPVSQISLDARMEGLAIKSVGSESIFEFTSIPASNDKTFKVLKMSIESQSPDIMTFDYMTDQPLVIQRPLKAGIVNVYLPLPFGKSLSLRINPGNNAGLFLLRSAEILDFPSIPDVDRPIERETTVAEFDPKKRLALQSGEAGKPTVVQETDATLPVVSKTNMAVKNTADDTLLREMEGSVSEESSIQITDFKEGRIFQRKGTIGSIIISGVYTGLPRAIEARVLRNGTSEEVVPWTVVDPSPRNGIFLGELSGVPQGGWYNIQVRDSRNHAVSSRGSHKWAVGILVACLGQSNMKEWFHTGTDLSSDTLLRKHTDKGWSELGTRGNAAIAFGNRLIERLDVPVGLIEYSANGSGLRKEADWGTGYWENTEPGSIYNRFLAGISALGGSVEYVIWIQGEADAARGTVTEAEYRTSLERFITNQVRSDIGNGSTQANLPFLIVMMIKRPGGEDGPHQAIRNAQKYIAENVADCYLAATTLDLENKGRQHLAAGAYTTLGRRLAQTVLYILKKEKYYRGPSVTAVTRVDPRTIDITIQHRGGTDFTPAFGITGWEVLSGETALPVSQISRYDATTIRIVLKNTFSEDVNIRYLYGAMPDAAKPVLDNSAMALPLEAYH